jgi:hypothetical protein
MDIVNQAKENIKKENEYKAVQAVKDKLKRVDELKQEKKEIEKQIGWLYEVLDRWSHMSAEDIVGELDTVFVGKLDSDTSKKIEEEYYKFVRIRHHFSLQNMNI